MAHGRRAPQPQRTAALSLAAAALLVALKLGVGFATGSLALVSAGVESSGDVLAAALTFFAVRLGGRPADLDHPYGHRRAENLGALGEAAILLFAALLIAIAAIARLARDAAPPRITWYQFAVIGVALAVDVARISASRRAASRHGSPALRANAVHFAGDAAGSLAVLAGLVAVDAGLRAGDDIAALVVAAITTAAALRLLRGNASVLMDSAPESARASAEAALRRLSPEIEVGRLRLREAAGRYFADVVVSVPPGRAVVEGHAAADAVERALEDALPGCDVVVHVEPSERLTLRDRVLAIALAEPLVREAHDIAIYDHGGRLSVSLHLKFPADLALARADEVARRVERAIGERPGVGEVQTHLEPLERTVSSGPDRAADGVAGAVVSALGEFGGEARECRVFDTAGGLVVFVTVDAAGEPSLEAAHDLASRLEERVRRRVPGIVEVVVRTGRDA